MLPKLEDCKPPIRPTGYNVLVALDVVGKRSTGGIVLPDRFRNREDSASEKGLVVAVSPMAFKGGDWLDEPEPPKVGETVIFQRYDGKELDLEEETEEAYIKYRVISDAAIKGICNEESNAKSLPKLPPIMAA